MLTIVDRAHGRGDYQDRLVLPFDLRSKSRLRVRLESGQEAALLLDRGGVLRGGDRLKAEDGRSRQRASYRAAFHAARHSRRLMRIGAGDRLAVRVFSFGAPRAPQVSGAPIHPGLYLFRNPHIFGRRPTVPAHHARNVAGAKLRAGCSLGVPPARRGTIRFGHVPARRSRDYRSRGP